MSDGLIAIVGASCRFPGAPSLDEFWELLTTGTDAVSTVGSERWSTRYYYHPKRGERGRSYSWSAGLIDGVDLFEPAFFGISPREAAQMDPQQRLMLELAWHASEDAGIPASRFAGSSTGVYVGASSTDFRDSGIGDPAAGDLYTMTGATLSIIANRVSYVFDLRGPSLVVDTACSSSLVALHHACEAIRAGRIEQAIVGGVNLLLAPYPFIGFCNASMLSQKGRCFAFDARADGYVRAEGGGVVILKPLAQALADGDRIKGVIVGTGVNSDGRTIGLSLPSEAAQSALLRSVYAGAEVTPDQLAFFEMHGTGTPAGDPIEAAAVGGALGRGRERPLPIGSVKTNIGHLEPASGMAGLLKAALALERNVIPPSLHCETPNPKIPFDELNLRMVREPESIVPGSARYAGVNSFGFGGTNGHAVLAQPPTPPSTADCPERAATPLVLSARSEASLRALVQAWRGCLVRTPSEMVPDLLRAAARRREQHSHRLVALGSDAAETAAALERFLDTGDDGAVITGTALREARLGFVFSGNGAQWPGMGQKPFRANRAFRDAVCEVDALLNAALGWSAAEAIERGIEADALVHADVAQPLLFAIQYGIVRVLRGLGIDAAGHTGHSVGEIAAAWASGALSLGDAVRVVVARSRAQERTRGDGRMAALGLGVEAAEELLAETGVPLEIGAVNSRQSVTISGPAEAIERLSREARRRGVACRALDLDFAFHSALMDPIREKLVEDLSTLRSLPPQSHLVSTVTGAAVGDGALDAEYWWRNIRNPVRFTDAVGALAAEGCRILVEIGPHPVLQSYLHDALRAAAAPGRVLSSFSRKQTDGDPFPALAAECHVAGCDFTGASRFDGPSNPAGLPLYPWQRERFWFAPTVESPDVMEPVFEHPLLGFRRQAAIPYWRNVLDPEVMPWLADHAIEGVPVLPAAAVVEMVLATARARQPNAAVLEVSDLELRRPLPFDAGGPRELSIAVATEEGDWELSSRQRLAEGSPTLHAVARIATAGDAVPASLPEPNALPARTVEAKALYALAAKLGLNYGAQFRTVSRIDVFAPDRARVHFDPSAIVRPIEEYLIHPALLDGALQGLLALLADGDPRLQGISFLPWRFGRVRFFAGTGRLPSIAEVRLIRLGSRSAAADIVLADETGAIIAECSNCWMRRVELTRRGAADDRVLRVDLVPAPLDMAPSPLGAIAALLPDLAGTVANADSRSEQAMLLDALIASIAYRAVAGVIDPDVPFTLDVLVEQGQVAPDSVAMIESLLRLLERLSAAAETAGEWQLSSQHDLPEAADIWRLLLAEAPELVAELALIADAGQVLPQLIAEGCPHAGGPLPGMVEHLLNTSPASEAGFELVCRALTSIAADWPNGRPLRILALGAGSGGSRRFLDRLSASGVTVSYLATSPDPDQAARLAFAVAPFVGATARCWSPGESDDLTDGPFDLVLAVNASAGLHVDAAALARLRDLVAPGGLFLAIEPVPNPLWDLVFGRSSEWWQTEAGGAPSRLRTGDAWRRELAMAGFAAPRTVPVATGPWATQAIWGTAAAGTDGVVTRPATGSIVQLVGATERARAAMTNTLTAAGHRVVPAARDAFAALDDAAERAVLVVDEADDPVAPAASLIPKLVRVASLAAERRIPLVVLTAGAQQVGAATATGLSGAAVWGFARVLSNEMPRLELRLVDLPASVGWAERGRLLAAELSADSTETEVVWTADGRHVPRVRRGLPPRYATASDIVVLGSDQPGSLDALGWKSCELGSPGLGEVEVEVEAAGLNFRDMMWAMGLLPEEALIDGFAGAAYGLECAGIVRAVGSDVEGLSVGDRVAGFAPAALSSRVRTRAHALMPIPDEVGFAAAATIPVAFVTAVYALGTLARLAEGEHVLIHAAAGGVGLAAIQYAKYRGAVVIATAGSEIKRAFLRLAGADHVLDSRDLGFADAARALTGGAGVDVVLNSLSGEAMELSLGVLKPFGRFLELGKRDFYLNRRVHLRPLRQNISYFGIDVDQLPVQRPDIARELLSEIAAALKTGAIRPLAHRRFSFAEVDEAFRLMQSSGHIGKLVLEPDDNTGVRLRDAAPMGLSPDGTYLVTGGLTGFGFEAARWLVGNGAKSIALVGRRGVATPGAIEKVHELVAAGAEVSVHAGDVGDRSAIAGILQRIRETGQRLTGVVHAASAISDGLAADIDAGTIEAMLGPKLRGAVLLDQLTRDDPVDLFLLFSSATTLLGAPGQGVYVAANLALEALARHRRAAGKPALAVAWGPIADAGYLAERPDMREALARRLGAKPIPAAQALSVLPAVARSGLAMAAIAETSWQEARHFLPTLANPMFAELRGEAGTIASDESLLEKLAAATGDEVLSLLKAVVAEEAANILRLPAGGIEPARPLSEMGMDSLMAVELRLALENRLRIDLPLVSLAEGTSVSSIAGRLAGALSARPHTGEIVSLVERYEGLGDTAVAVDASEPFDPADIKSEAAE